MVLVCFGAIAMHRAWNGISPPKKAKKAMRMLKTVTKAATPQLKAMNAMKAMKAMKMTKIVTKAAVPQPNATKTIKAMKMTKAVTKAAGSREGHEGHEDDEGR